MYWNPSHTYLIRLDLLIELGEWVFRLVHCLHHSVIHHSYFLHTLTELNDDLRGQFCEYTYCFKTNWTHCFASKIWTIHNYIPVISRESYSIHAWYSISISPAYRNKCGNASTLGFAKKLHVQGDCLKARQFCFLISPTLIGFTQPWYQIKSHKFLLLLSYDTWLYLN